jgi:hypothetical protein
MIYLVDIDGTIADLTHRLHFIQQKPADWDAFFAVCPADKPIPEVIEVVQALAYGGMNRIFMVTGRSDAVREQTQDWLYEQNIPFCKLFMRKAGDHREDAIVKSELLDEILKTTPQKRIGGVFEDRQQVVDMYQNRGLRVFQVAPGNF